MSVTVTKLADGWKHEQTTVKRCTRHYWAQATSAADLQNVLPARNSTPSYTDWPSGYRVDSARLEGVGNANSSPYIAILIIEGATKISGSVGGGTTKVGEYQGSLSEGGYAVQPQHLGCSKLGTSRTIPKTSATSQEEGMQMKWDGTGLATPNDWVYDNGTLVAAGSPNLATCELTAANGLSTTLTPPDIDKTWQTLVYSLTMWRSTSDVLAGSNFMKKAVSAWGAANKYFPRLTSETGLNEAGRWRTAGFSYSDDTDFDGTTIIAYTMQFESIPFSLNLYWNPTLYGALSLTSVLG